jgi:dTMP kinase
LTQSHRFICFSGIDGSGKTSQALALFDTISKTNNKCKYIWIGWDPIILKPVIKCVKNVLFRKKNIKENEYIKYTALKREIFRSPCRQRLYLAYVLIDYFFQVIIKIKIPLALGYLVICDRYIYDVFIDFAINFHWSVEIFSKEIKKLPLWLFTKPNITYFIDTPEEIAFRRKFDIPTIEYLIERRVYYQQLAIILKMKNINGDNTFENIHNEICKTLGIYK